MLRSLQAAFERAAMERITLLLNHVLAAEPVATARLAVHAGAVVQIEFAGWSSLLPIVSVISDPAHKRPAGYEETKTI